MKKLLSIKYLYLIMLMALTTELQASGDRSVEMSSTLIEDAYTQELKELKNINEQLYYLGSNKLWHVFAYIESSKPESTSSKSWSWPWSDPEPIPMPWSYAVIVKLDIVNVEVLNNHRLLLDGRSQYIPHASRVTSVNDDVVTIYSPKTD